MTISIPTFDIPVNLAISIFSNSHLTQDLYSVTIFLQQNQRSQDFLLEKDIKCFVKSKPGATKTLVSSIINLFILDFDRDFQQSIDLITAFYKKNMV